MSCMEEEGGFINFGVKSYNAFKKELVLNINKIIEDNFMISKRIYSEIRNIYEVKKNELDVFDLEQEFIDYVLNKEPGIEKEWQALYILSKIRRWNNGKVFFLKLHKKDFKKVSGKTMNYNIPGDHTAVIEMNDKERSLSWSVREGNNTVGDAYQIGSMGWLLCNIMSEIVLEKGKGGVFYGNDEYNMEDGHSDYKTREWKSSNIAGGLSQYIIHREM